MPKYKYQCYFGLKVLFILVIIFIHQYDT